MFYETQVTILGVGERITGTNPNGGYDLVNVAFSFPDKKMDGVNAASLTCPGHFADQLIIGDSYKAMLVYVRQDRGNGKYRLNLSKIVFL